MLFKGSRSQPKHRRFSYEPRYTSDEAVEQTPEQTAKRLSFRSGGKVASERKSGIAGKLRTPSVIGKDKRGPLQKTIRLGLLVATFAAAYAVYQDMINAIFGFFMVFILLILFIQRTHKG